MAGSELITHEKNKKDGLYGRVPKSLRDLVMIDFAPLAGSDTSELAAHW